MATAGEYHPSEGPNNNPYIEALVSDSWWDNSAPVTFYLSDDDNDGRNWNATSKAAMRKAFELWSAVADIEFQEVNSAAAANMVEIVDTADGYLGYHYFPDTFGPKYQSEGHFNINGMGWTNAGLQMGGYGFVTMIHEIGHGLGLEHPHDGDLFPGVRSAFNDYGSNNLNQGIFTTMTYNDGWASEQNPAGKGLVNYGYQATPGAFDIAAMQFMYGANNDYATGDDTYQLPEANQSGTFWATVWDAGGTDTMRYDGNRDAIVDLTAATLDNTPTGGGVPSYAKGIYGGFTIANGVVIENAGGGGGDDRIVGNRAANVLTGNNGLDTILGAFGDDTLMGGGGRDRLRGDDGYDSLRGGSGNDRMTGGRGADQLFGDDGNDRLIGSLGADRMDGGADNDLLKGGRGNDLLFGGGGTDRAVYSGDADRYVFKDLGAGRVKIIDNTGKLGTDILDGIERLVFSSGTVDIDTLF